MPRPPHIRRQPRSIFNQAALAPLRLRPVDAKPIDLHPTPYRRYLAGQIRDGNIKWHPKLGWRLHGEGRTPQAQNANVRDMVRAHWVTESGDAVTRELKLTRLGEQLAPPSKPDGA